MIQTIVAVKNHAVTIQCAAVPKTVATVQHILKRKGVKAMITFKLVRKYPDGFLFEKHIGEKPLHDYYFFDSILDAIKYVCSLNIEAIIILE